MIEGSNMAEAHPVGFQWVMEAKRRGATIIHVDPRFSRTSAVSDMFVPIRAGTDIVFLGALISYVLENEKYFKEYVVPYTNASAILNENYRDTEDLDGLFSGWVEDKGQYEGSTWSYEGAGHKEQEAHRVPESHAERSPTRSRTALNSVRSMVCRHRFNWRSPFGYRPLDSHSRPC